MGVSLSHIHIHCEVGVTEGLYYGVCERWVCDRWVCGMSKWGAHTRSTFARSTPT